MDLGYDLGTPTIQMRMITASGIEVAPQVVLRQAETLGRRRLDFPIICYTVPSYADVNGVLGLDFLRGLKLTLDFRAGLITLE